MYAYVSMEIKWQVAQDAEPVVGAGQGDTLLGYWGLEEEGNRVF